MVLICRHARGDEPGRVSTGVSRIPQGSGFNEGLHFRNDLEENKRSLAHQYIGRSSRPSRLNKAGVSSRNGEYQEEAFRPARSHNSFKKKPKSSTIILYGDSSSGTKTVKKAAEATNKTFSHFLPKKVCEKKRAVSAGRLRKNTESGNLERKEVLNYMLGDHVIDELDLAMQTGKKTRFRQQEDQRSGDPRSRYLNIMVIPC